MSGGPSDRNADWLDASMAPGALAEREASAARTTDVAEAEMRAAELFVHGLLLSRALDDVSTREARVRRALAAMPRRQPLRLAPAALSWMAAAVLVFAFGALSIFTLSTEPSAIAMVAGSLEATATGGDRSYRVLMTPQAGGPERVPESRFDMRNREHQRFEAIAPDGSRFVTGRDARGGWAIRPDGTIDRFPAPTRRPRWIDLGEDLFLAASLDDLLEALPTSFEVRLGEPAQLPGAVHGALLRRVTATRRIADEREPERVELWIDPETRLVHRLELHWSERTLSRPPRGDRRPGSGRGDPNWRERSALGPPIDCPPGLPPHPRADHLPELPPPHGAPAPRGLMPPPPRRDGPPHLPDGRPHPPRGFLDGPPNFRDRAHPPPPKSIVFELIEAPSFPEGWFSPEE